MTTAIRPRTTGQHSGERDAARACRQEVERRLARVLAALEEARGRLHQAHLAARAAEEALLLRRLESEQAAEAVAELADLADSLQRGLAARTH